MQCPDCESAVLTFLKTVPIFWFLAVSQLFNLLEFLPLLYLPVTAVLLVWFARLFRACSTSAAESWAKETASEGGAA